MSVAKSSKAPAGDVVVNLQGLRAIAALLVVLVHASLPRVGVEDVLASTELPWLAPFRYIGIFGVDLFFAISGFIMLVTNRHAFARPNAGIRFLARRAIRIYPPYWLALAAIAPVYIFARDRYMVSHTGTQTGIVQSLLLLPQPTRFLLPVAWTLVWELLFYVVFSQILRFERRYVARLLALWFAVEVLLYVTLGHATNFYVAFLRTPLPMEFIFGAWIGLLYDRRTMPAPRTMTVVAILATAAAWSFVAFRQIMLQPEQLLRIALFGIPAALLVYAAVALEMHGALRVPRRLASLGDASYAIYLWHVSILVAIRQLVERLAPSGPLAHAIVIATTLAIVIVVGSAVYRFFERPVTSALNRLVSPRKRDGESSDVKADRMERATGGIAIVGIAGRFPGAADTDEFWRNLCEGKESITRFDAAECDGPIVETAGASDAFAGARSILDDSDCFDAPLFGMHAREAELTDPQHRVLLETSWTALEDAGYDPSRYAGAIGVVAGCSVSSYFLRNVLGSGAAIDRFTSDYQVAGYPELIGSGHDFVATRIAYKLDLRGPALTVQSACSTALLAVAQAAQSLMLGQADMMLAGAASITYPQRRRTPHEDGGMISADGHCRTFDADASGTVFGSGAGVVVLKRVEDARADGDRIYAVIRGFGVNNDGSAKVGYTAPSVAGQAAAIAAAQAMAGFEPSTIGYVECHGTATPLGDPIEIAALTKAFGDGVPAGSCAIGSVKTNVGHLDVAAGMSGLIKTVLAIHHGRIPATLHYDAPNPHIDFASGPFYVNARLDSWRDERRRAGVSAFGIGGTNVHVVLDAETAQRERAVSPEPAEPALLVLSANSPQALDAAAARLADRLRATSESIADIAFTLQAGRRTFPHRLAFSATTPLEAASKLASARLGATTRGVAAKKPRISFLFPGQGAQYPGMGRGLYESVPSFRAAIDRCAEILAPSLGRDLWDVVFARDTPAARATLTATANAQPSIFAIEYALAQMWIAYGAEPTAMIGHSVGEFVAACLAGVMSLDDALTLVAERGRLMQALPRGAMTAVGLSRPELETLLPPGVVLAADNAPSLAVAAGPFAGIEALERDLLARDVSFRRVDTSHAFHSMMMDPVVTPLLARVKAMRLDPPAIPYVSSVTGTWIEDHEATSPEYWAAHCRKPVLFTAGVTALARDETSIFIEAGPGTSLATFVRQTLPKSETLFVTGSLPGQDATPDFAFFLASLGGVWTRGGTPAWETLQPRDARRVSLPTYPFEKKRYWATPSDDAPDSAVAQTSAAAVPRTEIADMNELVADRHRERVRRALSGALEELSGEIVDADRTSATFLELGFDSIFLGRFAQHLKKRLGLAVTFRALLGDYPSLDALTDHALTVLPVEAEPVPVREAPVLVSEETAAGNGSALHDLMRAQLDAMQRLMQDQRADLLRTAVAPVAPSALATGDDAKAAGEAPSRFKAYRTGAPSSPAAPMTPTERAHVDALIARTVMRTNRSKQQTERYRDVLADPRAAAGFRMEWKEMVYPITCVRAKGSRIWDIDGNEYIDIVNGFGQTAFGHAPDFVLDAVSDQLQRGFAIGPQSDAAGPVAELFCEITGNERATFCNTGSEAVMAAIRIARTVTGRDRIVVFSGAYHGQFDEVLVEGARSSERSRPAAAGIPSEAVSNVRVLDYGARASLDWIRSHADELAAIIVEPVQSRHPALQPVEFLRELRALTDASGTALVFDEVVTGFRMHPAGLQEVFGIRADLATYGKVVGGGLPIGILAGKRRFMDALDGGAWRFGDDSYPEVAPTFFAGTFVRHPLVLAAVRAVLEHVKHLGPSAQFDLASRTAQLVRRLNDAFDRRAIATRIETCGSMFYVDLAPEGRLASLLFYHLRERGIYVLEGFPCFLTTEHTDADLERIATAFEWSLDALCEAGVFFASRDLAPAAAPSPLAIPLTEQQTEIWLAAQNGDDASCAFNESITLHVSGTLDESAFARAWNQLFERHEALRATFDPTGEHMHVGARRSLDYAVSDLTSVPAGEAARLLAEEVARDARRPFDLVSGPVARGHLFRLPDRRAAFLFTAHHIVCDGWSMNVLLEEFATVYGALVAGRTPMLDAALQFGRYARDQHDRPPAERAEVERYWLERFAEPVSPLELPTDRPRAAIKTFAGATRSTTIDAIRSAALKKAGAEAGSTLFGTLLGAFTVLVARLADRRDIVVGVPAAGQALVEGRALVGHCVDFLPIRQRLTPSDTLGDVLASMKTHVIDAFEHQDYTLGTLVRVLAPTRYANRLPLTDLQFNLERLGDNIVLPDLTVRVEPNPKAFVNSDVFLNVVDSTDGLHLHCDYNTDLFDVTTIDRWLAYYENILDAIVADSTQRVDRVAYMPDSERQAILSASTDSVRTYPHDATVAGLFATQARLRPDAIAIVCGDDSITYAELDGRANELALRVLEHAGGRGGRVGVAVRRSAELVVSLLGVLKAGSSYVPLDLSNGDGRLAFLVEDAGLTAVIVNPTDGARFMPDTVPAVDPSVRTERLVSAPAIGDGGDGAMYTIYTSGTTGGPKGVEVGHRSVVNFLASMAREPGLDSGAVLVAVTPVTFDIAALELFLPLVVGGTVVIASREESRDGFRLLELLRKHRATVMQATPSSWRMLLEAGFRSPPGFTMLCGGEPLTRDLANRLLAGAGVLWNMYGPTETTIWSSCGKVVAGDHPITIGRPIANTRMYVLDSNDQLVPIGRTGQLHVAGDGVARGYRNRPNLTAEKFVDDPFSPGRMYRTGDLARLMPSGDFQVLGRSDDQIKLRGFRIEPNEIEAAIAATADVAGIAVALREDAPGGPRLVAYYVARNGLDVVHADVASALADRLPDYMIPTVWIPLEALPLNANGKLDRAALPAFPALGAPSENFVAPRTPIELALGKIWSDVLQLDRVSVDDDLLALGADSINIFQITARANRDGLRLVAKQLLETRTIRKLGRALEAGAFDVTVATAVDRREARLDSLTARIHANA